LVVEDDALQADVMAQVLMDAGYDIAGPALDLPAAVALIEDAPIAAALLDVNMNGVFVYPVADLLRRRRVPFAFVTGFSRTTVPATFRNVPVLAKPFRLDVLSAQVQGLTRPPRRDDFL
jgi:DNA-binding response OmpR family regulator